MSTWTTNNVDSVPIPAGFPIAALQGQAGVVLAGAPKSGELPGRNRPFGLAVTGASPGEPCTYQFAENLVLSDWTAVTGSVSLQVNTDYFLWENGPVPLVSAGTDPQAITEKRLKCHQVGRALNAQTMMVKCVHMPGKRPGTEHQPQDKQ
jgi:hypothetical protein